MMARAIAVAWLLTLASCSRSAAPDPHAPERAARHTVLMAGNRAGTQSTLQRAGGGWTIEFEYNDRGRGPRTRTEMQLDPRGLPASLHTTGVDYFKGPVDEKLSGGGGLRWKNKAESGSSAAGSGFYLSMYGPPEETAMLARALLRAPGGSLDLLPAGRASARVVDRMTVSAGGRREAVELVAIEGVGFTPSFVWLRRDGSLFAQVSAWLSLVPEGWEQAAQALLDRQDRRSAERAAAIAKRTAHRPPGGLLAIRGAALFDAERAAVRPGTTILVRGERIERVGPDGSFPIPGGAEVIDAGGRMVLPGLWDMHVHIGEVDGVLHLAAGVTSARDLANDIDTVLDLRKRIDAGELVGPRLVLAGIIDGPGPYAGPTKMLVDTEAEARAAVDRYADLGYEQVKIYSSVPPALVPIIAEHAHLRRMRVSGHVPASMRAEEAVRAGFDEIQHANMLVLNFLPDVRDTRTPLRFTAVGDRAVSLDLGAPPVRAFADLLRGHGTVVDPTLSVFEDLFTAGPGEVPEGYRLVADRLPPQVRRGLLVGGLPAEGQKRERYRASFARMVELVGMLDRAGVTIVPGTDSMPGFALHRELELYVQAGIPAARVLQLATLGAARVARRDSVLGSIAPGKLADLVMIDGDAARDIAAVRAVDTVIKGGVRYSAAELLGQVGVRPAARTTARAGGGR